MPVILSSSSSAESSSTSLSLSLSGTSSSSSSSSSMIYCNHPICFGAECSHFSIWTFNGVTQSNTDRGKLHVVFNYENLSQQIELYKGLYVQDLVAFGESDVAGIIHFTERNSSGLSGSVIWDGSPVVYFTYVLLSCESSSSQSSTSSSSSSFEYSTSSSISSESSSSSVISCCTSYKCRGAGCEHFANWLLYGVNNTNSDACKLYAAFDIVYTPDGYQEVRLYKDPTYESLVVIGVGADPLIRLYGAEDSGITGQVNFDGTSTVSTDVLVACTLPSSSSSSSISSSSSTSISSSSSFFYSSSSSSSSSSVGSSSSSTWSSASSSSSSISSSSIGTSSSSSTSSSESIGNTTSSSSSLSSVSESSISSLSSSSSSSSSLSSSSSSTSSYSSSSSSSYLEHHSARTIPFVFDVDESSPILCITTYNDVIFAGTGVPGVILRSPDGYIWDEAYELDDTYITSLFVSSDILYAGTAPLGKIYAIDLATNVITLTSEIGAEVKSFVAFDNDLYAITSRPSGVYVYRPSAGSWVLEYTPYAAVTSAFVLSDKLYVFMEAPHYVVFDGDHWSLGVTSAGNSPNDNLSSKRSLVTQNEFSHVYDAPIEVQSGTNNVLVNGKTLSISELQNEDVVSIYPESPSLAVSCAVSDGTTVLIGSMNGGELYLINPSAADSILTRIFQTDGDIVHSVVNISSGVDLAAIDNQVYLVKMGVLPSSTSTTTTVSTSLTETTTTQASTGDVKVLYPNGGELIEMGTTATITWSSERNQNDAMRIELYSGGKLNTVITDKTTNTGAFDWFVPTTLAAGADYTVKIMWLSASTGTEASADTSDKPFSIVYLIPSTTTTTTTPRPEGTPDISEIHAVPVLELDEGDYVTTMMSDTFNSRILIGTHLGRIILCDKISLNAYFTGQRTVYAEVRDGFGHISKTATLGFFYGLYNRIAEVNQEKEIVRWKFEKPYSAITSDSINGIFISPALYVKEDLGFWKKLMWEENKPDGTDIVICVRTANSVEGLYTTPWDYCFTSNENDHRYGMGSLIVRDLMDINIAGQYIQFRVTMSSSVPYVAPTVANVTISYSTKFAVYFYTVKFSLEDKSNIQRGLLCANITEPIHTEVKFGVSNKHGTNWNDYVVMPPNQFFALDNYENVKVGIKMISYDDHVPEVAEFALLLGGEKLNRIGEST